jgi:hypothetical protein
MTPLTEGQLTFHFPENALVSKYDDWSFYRNQFLPSFVDPKAVDFIYIDDTQTWLIEIKDYRIHNRTKPSDIAQEIALKVKDTLAGLVCAKNNANDTDEKTFAKAALKSKKIRVVLHLEQPKNQRRIDPADVLSKLKKRLKALDTHPCVVDQFSLKENMKWKVS